MNTSSCDCHQVATTADVKQPGDFCFSECDGMLRIIMWLPGEIPDDLGFRIIPIRRNGVAETHPPWEWDGNKDKPTLKPSILARGMNNEEIWHGHMTAGRLVSC